MARNLKKQKKKRRRHAGPGLGAGARELGQISSGLRKRIEERARKSGGELVTLPERQKMSEVIVEFLGPLLDETEGAEARKALISVGILAWNAASVPREEQAEAIWSVRAALVEAMPNATTNQRMELAYTIDWLLERKRRRYAANNRVIIDYEFTDAGDIFHFNVVSTVSAVPDA